MMDAATASASAKDWRRNRLLDALPAAEQERLAPHLELVDLGRKEQLYEAGGLIGHVYFPLTSVMSLISVVDESSHIEVATIGSEGMSGLPAFLGTTTSVHLSFCQVPGQALRLEVGVFRRLLPDAPVLHHLLHLYTEAMMVFLAQNVACNQLHSTEERCARWLAQTHDRVASDTFPLTQELLSQMLGVRRATVSLNAAVLQRAGLIQYTRGRITILDPDGLRAAACDCYQLVRDQFATLPATPP